MEVQGRHVYSVTEVDKYRAHSTCALAVGYLQSDALNTDLRTGYSSGADMRNPMMVVDVKNPRSSLGGALPLGCHPRVNKTVASEKGSVCLRNDE
jgi:hypothetical protein